MAYITKKKDDEIHGADAQPNSGLLGGYAQQLGQGSYGYSSAHTPQALGYGAQAAPKANIAQGSGPTVTGHINFDSIYAANEATAKREADRLRGKATSAAQGARQGLAGIQGQFNSQSKSVGAVGMAPSANEAARASGGGTAFYRPPAQTGGGYAQSAYGASSFGQGLSHTTANGARAVEPVTADTEAAYVDRLKQGAERKYQGPNSLQDVAGFSGLLDDYKKAEGAVGALKDDEHLQAAYEQEASGPYIEGGSRLNAALAGAAGRPQFAETRERYKGLGSEVGDAVKASVEQANDAKAQAARNAGAYQGLLDGYMARTTPQSVPGDSGAPSSSGFDSGYGSYQDFMADQGIAGGLHAVAEGASPVDSLLNKLGEAGVYQGGTVAGGFRQGTGADGAVGTDMDNQNRSNAFRQIAQQYGEAAARWLWDTMTQDVWDGMAGQNSGAILKTLRDLVEAHGGFGGVDKGNGQGNSHSELQDIDKGISDEDAGGPNGEPSRNDAAREGWLTSYDEQKRNGVRYPVRPK